METDAMRKKHRIYNSSALPPPPLRYIRIAPRHMQETSLEGEASTRIQIKTKKEILFLFSPF